MKKYCLLLALLISLRTNGQMNAGDIITHHAYHEIPFTDVVNEIHAKATLHGDEYDFLLDTGAPAFISEELQDKYHFKSLIKGNTQDAAGNVVKTNIVLIDTIRFGPFVFTGIPAIVINMNESPLGCLHTSGNVGSNMLRYLYVQFDLQQGRVAFTDDKTLLKHNVMPTNHMLINKQSDVYFPVTVNNSFTDTIHFDSGDGSFYSMSRDHMDKYITAFPSNIVRTGFGNVQMGMGGMGEPTPQYKVKPHKTTIAGNDLGANIISVAGNNRSRMGRDLLQSGVPQLNYPDSSYAFEPYTNPMRRPEFDYGFQTGLDGDDYVAGCVWKGSPAEAAGMQMGDRLLQMGSVNLEQLSKCESMDALRELFRKNEDHITVTFRHKKHKPQTVTLARTDFN